MRVVERRPPELPSLDQAAPEKGLDQLEVDRAQALERPQLLEVIELAIQNVCLVGVFGDKGGEGLAKLFGGPETADHPPRLDQAVLVPPAYELGRHLRLAAAARLAHLLRREHRGSDPAQQADGQDRRRDRGDLAPVDRRGWQRQLHARIHSQSGRVAMLGA